MNCTDLEHRLVDELDGILDAARRGELDAHLATCPACREEAASLRRIWDGLGQLDAATVPADVPSQALRRRFQAMLASYEDGLAAAREQAWSRRLSAWLEGWWPRRPAWQLGLVAAALVAGLGLGLGLRAPAPDDLAELRTEVASLSRQVSLSLLERSSASERLQGVSFSRRAPSADDEVLAALLRVLDRDPSVNVRLAALDALARWADRPSVADGLRSALPEQRSPLVQVALVDLLLATDGPQSRHAVERLLDDPGLDATVRGFVADRLDNNT